MIWEVEVVLVDWYTIQHFLFLLVHIVAQLVVVVLDLMIMEVSQELVDKEVIVYLGILS